MENQNEIGGTPRVSFVLAAFKRRFLAEAIESILSQTYRNFELVVVDDCSPENLQEVVDQYGDPRLSYHRNETNLGRHSLIGAWNHAMSYARGEWSLIASDDDIYLPTFLERLLELSERYPDCELLHGRCATIDGTGRWTGLAEERFEFETQLQMLYARGVGRALQQAPDFMFKTDAYRRLGGFVDFPLAWFSDDATWLALAARGCAHSQEVLFCFRQSGINISTAHDRNIAEKIRAGELYKKWALELCSRIKPNTEAERRMLGLAVERVPQIVDDMAIHAMKGARGFFAWLGTLRRLEVSSALKRRMIGERYPVIRWLKNAIIGKDDR